MPGNIMNRLETLPKLMLASLPEDAPQLRDGNDAVALFAHAAMLSVGFRLVGLGEDHKIDADSTESNTKPLPKEWNTNTSSSYAFRYRHQQSALEFLLTVFKLGRKTVINALAVEDDKVHGFNVPTTDFVSNSSFPFSKTPSEGAPDTRSNSVVDLFISNGRLGDLWALFKINIVQKIAPGLQKSSETDDEDAETQAQGETRHAQPGRSGQLPSRPREQYDPLREDRLPPNATPRPYLPGGDPLAPEQPRPFPNGEMRPPGWDDEHDILRAPGRGGAGYRPPTIGDRDLYPQGLGPNDPLRIGGLGGFGPRGGGGMHPTREDFDPMGGDDGFGGGMSAPPGARFDPPFPGQGPPRGSGDGFGGGGGFGGFGGGGII